MNKKMIVATRPQKSVTAIISFKAAALRMRSVPAYYSRTEYMPANNSSRVTCRGMMPWAFE
jgi:hypothetical protein